MMAIIQRASRRGEWADPYFNTKRQHVIVLVDDDPSQLADYEATNRLALMHSDGGVVGLRLRHDQAAKTAGREWQDDPDRTQRAAEYTYDEKDAADMLQGSGLQTGQRLTDAILWTLLQGVVKPEERAELGHEPYYDDRGHAVPSRRTIEQRTIVRMFPRARGDVSYVTAQK